MCFAGGKLAPWGSFVFWGSVVLASAFLWLGEHLCTRRGCFSSAGSQAGWSGGWSCLGSLSSAHLLLPLPPSDRSQPPVHPPQPRIAGESLDPGLKQIPPSSGQEESWVLPQEPLARRSSSPLTYLSVLRDRLCLCLLMRKSMLCISAGSSAYAG